MPRSANPSAAARWLAGELTALGLKPGYRALEDWAARGLAPPPVRCSLGQDKRMKDPDPAGAVDQYAAVASVMRRGRPWQVSVIKLLVRGHLPTNPDLVRQAFRDLLAIQTTSPNDDPLSHAEQVAAQTAATPAGQPFLRAFERNLRRSPGILEPGTETAPVATGVLATLTLMGMGEPDWSPEAMTEAMAALGLPVADMSEDDRQGLARFADLFTTQVTAGPVLARIAAHVPLQRIQSAIPRARELLAEAMPSAVPGPGEDADDVLTAFAALMVISIEDAGGDQAMSELVRQARFGPAPETAREPHAGTAA